MRKYSFMFPISYGFQYFLNTIHFLSFLNIFKEYVSIKKNLHTLYFSFM